MPPPTQFNVIKDSDQERRIIHYGMRAQDMMMNQFSMREMFAEADRLYQREKNWTAEEWRARIANKSGDAHKYRDVTVPIVMPQVKSAMGYFTNVFLTGYPIFGVTASPPYEDAALQMEAIIGENQETAQWAREMMKFFGDGLKYNIHALECSWEQRTVFSIEQDMTAPNGGKPKKALWKGNVLRRMDPYNTFWDPRCAPADICREGEYVGYNKVLTRVRMKELCNDLFGIVSPSTVERALNSQSAAGISVTGSAPYSYYIPMINPFPTMLQNRQQSFDWMNWALDLKGTNSGSINYANSYIVTYLYGRIIPSTFGLNVPEANTPQVWKFIIVNGQVVLYAERQSNAHNFIPVFFGQPMEDGLDYQTKSFATDVEDMQQISSALWNGFIASKRRLVTDRVIYDPLRIRKDDINSVNPSAKIPVRPGAYGKPVGEAVYQFPYHDEAAGSLIQAADLIQRFANLINGQNPAQQGQFVKGNKTKHEYEDIMGHGNVYNQMMAIMTENQVLTPMKVAIKMNILQFQEDSSIYNKNVNASVDVKIDTIRQASVNFKVSDGIIPADKLMSEDEFAVALQTIGSSPQLSQGYNLAPMFSYIMKTRGADLTPFEKSQEQVQYEQQMGVWQQAAAMAAQKGAPFSTPMPQPPPTQQPGATSGTPNSANGTRAPNSGTPNTGAQNTNALASAQPAGTGD